jgi:protein-L-isoaspartate(D-aspartate) O-methyltransferase
MLHLRQPSRQAIRDELIQPRLERAIGVVYRPDTELASHYFQAVLPDQFDDFVWFDETHAITALEVERQPSMDLPDTYPFGL